jgi:hypothetical protein
MLEIKEKIQKIFKIFYPIHIFYLENSNLYFSKGEKLRF